MSSIPFFQVDAFAERPLTGNPAAVMPLEQWLDDALMQAIAQENNLSETAFTIPTAREDADFELRWFTPTAEVDLCGHATLAAGHILMTGKSVRFSTRSGVLIVSRQDGRLELDMRAANLSKVDEPQLCSALGIANAPVWLADGYNDAAIIELADEASVRSCSPDFAILAKIPRMAVVTARGREQDVVSRVFVPYLGIDEDPATGSAHAALVPYWTKKLGRHEFTALQASARSGILHCRQEGDRAVLGGDCHTVIVGQFQL
ncbi:MAG TPA: PhzF family phenazine biosynthesis protein [Sphingomicrobium sp.]|nr:PhzF family phenazine biosynthesis protein [Sphingomicrobium sp.]